MESCNNKVAVINRTNFKNYGSVLQCYALCEIITELGFDSEILWEEGSKSKNFDFRPRKLLRILLSILKHPSLFKGVLDGLKGVKQKQVSEETVLLFEKFVGQNIKVKNLTHKELVELAKSEEYVKFVCGSDQVWCSTTAYVDPLMYLRFAPKQKRVAYAPSIGRDYIPSYNKRVMRKYINDIPNISIREDEGQKLIKDLTNRTIPVVADPTLLINLEHWKSLQGEIQNQGKYILVYFLDIPSDELQQNIREIVVLNNAKIVSIGCELPLLVNDENYFQPHCGPAEFLSYVASSKLMITDSYHGMLFSLIYNKEFFSIERNYTKFDQSSRQLTVLRKVNLLERYVKKTDVLNLNCDKIDYFSVNKILDKFKLESIEYLETALKN